LTAPVGTGLLGSLTTFSALVLQLAELVGSGRHGVAVTLAVASLGGGLVAAASGLRLGGRGRR
jgi:fluoride exporter